MLGRYLDDYWVVVAWTARELWSEAEGQKEVLVLYERVLWGVDGNIVESKVKVVGLLFFYLWVLARFLIWS